MTDRIREEADDIIILDENPWKILRIVFCLLLVIFLWWYTPSYIHSYFVFILLLIIPIFLNLIWLLYDESVIIDKKVGKLTIRSSIHFKEIPFTDIKCTELKEVNYGENSSWKLYIVTISREFTEIFSTENEFDAERVAEKIREISNNKITRDANWMQINPLQPSFTLELSELELGDGEVCPACAGKIKLLEPHRDRKGEITHYDAECIKCGLKGEVINSVF